MRPSPASRRLLACVWAGLLLVAVAAPAGAQRIDTVAVAPRPPAPVPDTLGPPISPRRAFLLSLAVPGLGQAVLDRAIPGAIFVTVEAVSLAMIRKTLDDLRLAQSVPDSIVVGYERDPQGNVIIDPDTGMPIPILEPTLLGARVRARRSHLEDWIVLLVFNHFFAGADAYVAAHLWEVPARVSLRMDPRGTTLAVRIPW